jgi:hypothetical protein
MEGPSTGAAPSGHSPRELRRRALSAGSKQSKGELATGFSSWGSGFYALREFA